MATVFSVQSGETLFWLTSDITSIIDHIPVVSVHTTWIWYTITRSYGVIQQKTYSELQGEPRTKAWVHEAFGEYLIVSVRM
jgi:hypothetical protein